MKVAVMTETAIIQRLAVGAHGAGGTAGARGVAGAEVNGSSRFVVCWTRGSSSYFSLLRRVVGQGSVRLAGAAVAFGVRRASGEGAIEMGVAAVDDDALAGGVGALRGREEEDGHGGDFGGLGEAMAEGNAVRDFVEGLLRIRARCDPSLIEGRHDFGGKYGVGADVVGGEFGGPLAGEGELRTFGGGVGGGSALAGERDLGADVDDGAVRGFEHGQRVVGHGVVVDEVLLEALDEAVRGAGGKADAVVGSGIVDEAEEAAVGAADVVDSVLALGGVGEVGFDEVAFAAGVEHFGEEVFDVVGGAADDDDGGALVEAGAGDSLADAGAAAGDEDDAVVKAQVQSCAPRVGVDADGGKFIRAGPGCEGGRRGPVLRSCIHWLAVGSRAFGSGFYWL